MGGVIVSGCRRFVCLDLPAVGKFTAASGVISRPMGGWPYCSSCPSVCLPVCSVRALNWKNKNAYKTNVGIIVLRIS